MRVINTSQILYLLIPETKVSMFLATVCRKVCFPVHLFGGQYLRTVCVRPRGSNGWVFVWAVVGGGGVVQGGFINCDVPPDLLCLEPKILIKTPASHLSTSFRSPAPDYNCLSRCLLARTWKTFCLLKSGVLGSSRYQSHVFTGVSSLPSWVFNANHKGNNRKTIIVYVFCSRHFFYLTHVF